MQCQTSTPSGGAQAGRRPGGIGIILVHGIGEQRRFEHLDSQLRFLLKGLNRQVGKNAVTVEIHPSGPSPFHAQSDTWDSGPHPSVTVIVRHEVEGQIKETRIGVHEVWWADVNEEYSLAKQLRFWKWGLSLWLHPGKRESDLPSSSRVAPAAIDRSGRRFVRARLYLVCAFFALLGASSSLFALVRKVFDFKGLRPLRVITNYVSGVKLYGQSERLGPGLFRGNADFLDAIDDPPRVSIRRRMVRAIADVACQGYDRWYILAHSLGTVVAFNGLMETSYAWPGYLDEKRWMRLKDGHMAGPNQSGVPQFTGRTMPPRPMWVAAHEIAYRRRIFCRFRGFLTYGSPLEKFAAIWPVLVPMGLERVFKEDIPWINLFDPLDPVSGTLKAFATHPRDCCPHPLDIGYKASWILLLSHLKYLSPRRENPNARAPEALDAATATVHWLLTDDVQVFLTAVLDRAPGWFAPKGRTRYWRRMAAGASWSVAVGILAVCADLWAFLLIPALSKATFASEVDWIERHPALILASLLVWPALAALAAAVFGLAGYSFFFKSDRKALPKGQATHPNPVRERDTFGSDEPEFACQRTQ